MIASTVQLIMAFNNKKWKCRRDKNKFTFRTSNSLPLFCNNNMYMSTHAFTLPFVHYVFRHITVFKNSCTLAPIPAAAAKISHRREQNSRLIWCVWMEQTFKALKISLCFILSIKYCALHVKYSFCYSFYITPGVNAPSLLYWMRYHHSFVSLHC